MGKVIRIDDDVYEGLKKLAQPFEDTPNSVIRRLLQQATALPVKPEAAPPPATANHHPSRGHDGRTPQAAFRPVILEVLAEMGGRAPVADVLTRVEQRMKAILTPLDFSTVSTGMPRWQVYARWERQNMRDQGLLTGVRGTWELTAKGRAQLQQDGRG